MIGSGNFGSLLDVDGVLRVIFGDSYAEHQTEYTDFCSVETSTKAVECGLSISTFGLAPEKDKGQSVNYETAKENWKYGVAHTTYALGFIVEEELLEDDQYGIIKTLPRSLSRSMTATIETVAANILNRAFNASYLGGDGLELCSELHLLGGGGTYRNELDVAADLDATSWEQTEIDIGAMVTDKGIPMAARPTKLIVPKELKWQAQKLFGSAQEPGSNYNDINPAKGAVPFAVNHYLTDTDAWFVTTDVPNGIVLYFKRKPRFGMDNDFDTGNGKWKGDMRFLVMWHDPRAIFGSPGA